VRGKISELEANSDKRHIREFYIGMKLFKKGYRSINNFKKRLKGLFDCRSAQNFEQMKRNTCHSLNVNGVI